MPKVRASRIVLPVREGIWQLERDGISQSMLNKFLACPERAKLAYIYGMTPKKVSDAMDFGTIFHDSLRAGIQHYKDSRGQTTKEECRLMAWQEADKYHDRLLKTLGVAERDQATVAETVNKVQAVLPGYYNTWYKRDTKQKTVKLEEPFRVSMEVPAIPGVWFAQPLKVWLVGMQDWLYRDETGGLVLLERKSKGRINELAIAQRLPIDFQTLYYANAAFLEFGEWPYKVVYEVTRNPQLRRRAKESKQEFATRVHEDVKERGKDWYFYRFGMEVLEQEWTKRVRTQMLPVLRDFLSWYFKARPHYKNSYACENGLMPCPFLPYCANTDRSGFLVRDVAHAELTGDFVPTSI